jgi:hypothetical protein
MSNTLLSESSVEPIVYQPVNITHTTTQIERADGAPGDAFYHTKRWEDAFYHTKGSVSINVSYRSVHRCDSFPGDVCLCSRTCQLGTGTVTATATATAIATGTATATATVTTTATATGTHCTARGAVGDMQQLLRCH